MKPIALLDADLQPASEPARAGSHSHYRDRPVSLGARLCGVVGASAVFGLILGAALFTWRVATLIAAPSPPLVIEFLPLAAPPEPVEEVPEGPQKTEQKAPQPVEDRPEPPPVLVSQIRTSAPPVEPPAEKAEAAEQVAETTAPKSLAAPPASRASSNAERSWEALLLAHLERYRRYPVQARARREQGVAYVRFRMNRAGQVLSVSLQRGSGSPTLDRAALDTIRRAQPLPAMPADRSDELELSVPVEFFLDRAPR